MEGNTQTPQPIIAPPPPVPPVIPTSPSKTAVFHIFFVVLILILLTATGVFAYQNMQLQKQIAILQSQPTPSTTLSPTPSSTPSTTPDLTAGWGTYNNTKHNYSFKYPSNYRVEQNGMISPNPSISDQITAFDTTASDPVAKPRFTLSAKTGNNNELSIEARRHFQKVSTYSFKNIKFNNLGYTAEDNKVVSDLSSITFQGVPAFTYTIRGSYVDDGSAEAVSQSTTRKYLWLENQETIFLIVVDDQSPSNEILSTFKLGDQTSSVDTSNWKTYSFPNVGIAFKAPTNLSVELTETKNTNTGVSTGYTLYIQNNSTDIKKFYQLYGIYQNPPNTNYSEKDLEVHKQDLIPDSITSITIDGHVGIRGQISGQRNRYVTHLLINNGLLSLFTAEPTVDNEKLSNQIIDTFKFTK